MLDKAGPRNLQLRSLIFEALISKAKKVHKEHPKLSALTGPSSRTFREKAKL